MKPHRQGEYRSMARIQITDINPAESGLLADLTETELLGVQGSGIWKLIKEIIDHLHCINRICL